MKSIISSLFYGLDKQYNHMHHLLYFLDRKQICAHGLGNMIEPQCENADIRKEYDIVPAQYHNTYMMCLGAAHNWPIRFQDWTKI